MTLETTEAATFVEAETMPELLRTRAAAHPDDPFVRLNDRRLTYGEFDARTDRVAAGLAELGVKPGDHVSVMAPNSIEFLEAWWGIWKAGAVFCPVNSLFTAPEAAHVIRDAQSVALIAVDQFAALVDAERDAIPDLRSVVRLDDSAGGDATWSELCSRGDAAPDVALDPAALAGMLYTSGTTGRPKGAMVSHGAYVADSCDAAELLPLRRGDTLGMILPLFHANAQVATTTIPILLGAEIAMWERFSASEFWAKVAEYQPATFSCVPTILAALLHAPGADDADTSSLEYVICGAAPLSRELFQRFEAKFGLRILEGYGLTESTCVSTINPYWGPRKVGSIGLPLRRQQIEIRDPDGRSVAAGEPGEVVIKGPNIMLGYYNLPEATDEAIRDGWLHTGDIAYQDDDGFIFLVDRVKDMIIRGGENIYPREIEEVLATHASIREVAVVGRPDEVRGEEVHAVVVLVDGSEASEAELVAHCEANLARYKVPRSWEFIDELPKNATGKIDKKPLRRALS